MAGRASAARLEAMDTMASSRSSTSMVRATRGHESDTITPWRATGLRIAQAVGSAGPPPRVPDPQKVTLSSRPVCWSQWPNVLTPHQAAACPPRPPTAERGVSARLPWLMEKRCLCVEPLALRHLGSQLCGGAQHLLRKGLL